ncbi:MAG: DNA repair protein RecN [Clostridia bacterium]|nr:DNA repair protein RecN [Clostridia bacterium]
MLSDLKIENVAVIEKAQISFEDGLNILTGETGAGKSIVIDSINAVLGERTSREIVRTGTDSAKVTAYFENISPKAQKILNELEIETENDDTLLISRTITSDGRSSCRVNGQPVTVSMLKLLGRELVNICGQHDSQHLLQKESHLDFVDFMADISDISDEYKLIYSAIVQKKKELSKLSKSLTEKDQRLEFLKYQINEIESANISPGEKERLSEDKKKLQNKEKLAKALYGSSSVINGDENTQGLSQGLFALSSFLSQISEFNSDFKELEKNIENFRFEIEECSSMINSEISSLDSEESNIDFIEERLDLLYRLSRKYGNSEEEILNYLSQIKEEYEAIELGDSKIEELETEIDELCEKLLPLAEEISERRKQAARDFEIDVMKELSYLDMPAAIFRVEFKQTAATSKGIDDVEFLISANAGQEPKSLSKIASGGELSRIMLAIKCVLSDLEPADTMIFDEIDSGVSGRAAHKIAYKLKCISEKKQTLCVTHLAQIAAAADHHFFIEKHSDESKTRTEITKLIDDDRIREIARIIGGDVITKTTMMSACELIDFANTP